MDSMPPVKMSQGVRNLGEVLKEQTSLFYAQEYSKSNSGIYRRGSRMLSGEIEWGELLVLTVVRKRGAEQADPRLLGYHYTYVNCIMIAS